MLRSLLLAAVAGTRAMTPFAAIAHAERRGELPADNGAPRLLSHPLVSAGASAIAAGEWAGDKMRSAPDRIIAPGLAARVATGALAAVSLAPRRQRPAAAALGAVTAIGSAYLTFRLRKAAMRRFGQTWTGVVEDALTLTSAALVVRAMAAPATFPPAHGGSRTIS